MVARHAVRERRPSWSAGLATATIVLSMFSGHFDAVSASVPLNRITLVLLLVSLLPRAGSLAPTTPPVLVALALQAAWAAGSAAHAGTAAQPPAFFALLDEVLVPACLFLTAPIAFRHEADRRLLLRALTLVALYLGVVSALQALGRPDLLFPRYLAAGAVDGQVSRATGPFLQAGANGAALAMCIPAGLLLARTARGTWRILAAAGVVVATLGCFLTLTRSVWLAGLAAVFGYCLLDQRLRRWIPALVAGAAVAVGVMLATLPSLAAAVTERFATERSIDDRTTTNAAALAMLREHPVGGVGWGRFLSVVDDYVRQPDASPLTNTHIIAHNVVLSRAAELGAIGALLLVATLVLGPLRAAVRTPPPGAVGWRGVVLGMFGGWLPIAMLTPMGYPFANYLLWTVTGLVLHAWDAPARDHPPLEHERPALARGAPPGREVTGAAARARP